MKIEIDTIYYKHPIYGNQRLNIGDYYEGNKVIQIVKNIENMKFTIFTEEI